MMRFNLMCCGALLFCAALFFVNALEHIAQQAVQNAQEQDYRQLAFGKKPHPKHGGCDTTVCTFEGRWP